MGARAVFGGEGALEEGAGDIISTQLNNVEVVALNCCSEDDGDGKEEEMVIARGSVSSFGSWIGSTLFHGTEACRHPFEGVIREELELEEKEEAKEYSLGRDLGAINEGECSIGDEHLRHLLGDSRVDCVAVIFH